MVQINQMAEVYQGINIAVYVSSTENTGAVSEDDLRDSVNSMEENEIGQTYTVDAGQNVLYDGEYAADYEMDESGQYGIYQRSFRYGKVPEFVKSTFGLTPELMRLNRVFAYLKSCLELIQGCKRLTFSPVGAKIKGNVAVQPVYVFDAKTG